MASTNEPIDPLQQSDDFFMNIERKGNEGLQNTLHEEADATPRGIDTTNHGIVLRRILRSEASFPAAGSANGEWHQRAKNGRLDGTMKVSLEWLGDFITWKVRDHRAIADRLTEAMGEIDDIVMQGEQLDRCCVGRVKSLAQHPNADRLRIAEIETDDGVKRVVCGGTNLKDGMLVAFAHIGASVQHGKDTVVLQKVKIRGEESEGMICAAEEIGLSERFPPAPGSGERPIVDLTDLNLKPGQDLATALGLTDTVLHIDNHAITHRPDLFSHLGVARECVALGLATWKKEPTFKHPHCPTKALPFALECDVPALVPHYRSVLLKVDGPGTTPDWMRRRLEATGWRSVSLPVDITN